MSTAESVSAVPERTIGTVTATGLVVASMIGGGVFITTGNLLTTVPSPAAVLLCWIIGGAYALSGALTYAELSVTLASNGGEYQFLSKLYHPSLGFVSAWVSLLVGFAAPTAAISKVFGLYVRGFFPGLEPTVVAAVLISLLSALNIWRMSASARFQDAMTIGKVLLVLGFAVVGLMVGDPSRIAVGEQAVGAIARTPNFALGLLVVSFAYTGWGSSVYVAGEVKDPEKVLPRALVGGTLLVTLLYVLINAAFLSSAPMGELRGNFEIARVAAIRLFGERGGGAVAGIIAMGLVSTAGAMIVTGPRVYEAAGADYPRLGWLTKRRASGGPLVATLVQGGLSLCMLLVDVDRLLEYIGFTLAVMEAMSVGSIFVLRRRGLVGAFRMPGYPIVPGLFVAIALWSAAMGLYARPFAGLVGLGTVGAGLLVWRLVR
jgi:APA family basic amino acid/polyamine antiporter